VSAFFLCPLFLNQFICSKFLFPRFRFCCFFLAGLLEWGAFSTSSVFLWWGCGPFLAIWVSLFWRTGPPGKDFSFHRSFTLSRAFGKKFMFFSKLIFVFIFPFPRVSIAASEFSPPYKLRSPGFVSPPFFGKSCLDGEYFDPSFWGPSLTIVLGEEKPTHCLIGGAGKFPRWFSSQVPSVGAMQSSKASLFFYKKIIWERKLGAPLSPFLFLFSGGLG